MYRCYLSEWDSIGSPGRWGKEKRKGIGIEPGLHQQRVGRDKAAKEFEKEKPEAWEETKQSEKPQKPRAEGVQEGQRGQLC